MRFVNWISNSIIFIYLFTHDQLMQANFLIIKKQKKVKTYKTKSSKFTCQEMTQQMSHCFRYQRDRRYTRQVQHFVHLICLLFYFLKKLGWKRNEWLSNEPDGRVWTSTRIMTSTLTNTQNESKSNNVKIKHKITITNVANGTTAT